MTRTLPALPYAFGALAPHISQRTLREHHGVHFACHVQATARLAAAGPFARADLETLVRRADGELQRHAAQTWNHAFYFRSLTPSSERGPRGELADTLDAAFGSFEAFREAFTSRALSHFGSGWAWLLREPDGRLTVADTHDAGCPLCDSRQPLLACDLWEHAYYLDRGSDRAGYVHGFWALVDWRRVAARLQAAQAGARTGASPCRGEGHRAP